MDVVITQHKKKFDFTVSLFLTKSLKFFVLSVHFSSSQRAQMAKGHRRSKSKKAKKKRRKSVKRSSCGTNTVYVPSFCRKIPHSQLVGKLIRSKNYFPSPEAYVARGPAWKDWERRALATKTFPLIPGAAGPEAPRVRRRSRYTALFKP